jgi:hypothetical protein
MAIEAAPQKQTLAAAKTDLDGGGHTILYR